jgi:hypothetical protein
MSMRAVNLPWTACVFTFAERPSDYGDLRNALLYASSVGWISVENFLFLNALVTSVRTRKRMHDLDLAALKTETCEMERGVRAFRLNQTFRAELERSGLKHYVRSYLTAGDICDDLMKPLMYQGDVSDVCEPIDENISSMIEGSHMVLGDRYDQDTSRSLNAWSTYDAATSIYNAMSTVLLPDVSDLPLTAIAEMRDRLSDTLDPMRAEILRFTEELRSIMTGKAITQELLAREAHNLVATRVEPIIREANTRATEMRKSKFKALFANAAKAFGFVGAAFIDPKMIVQAVQQTLETGALAFGDPENNCTQPRATAQFVLRARTMMSGS